MYMYTYMYDHCCRLPTYLEHFLRCTYQAMTQTANIHSGLLNIDSKIERRETIIITAQILCVLLPSIFILRTREKWKEMMQVIEVPPNIHVHHIMSFCTCVCHRYIVVNLAGKYMYMYVHVAAAHNLMP